jgi:hypothetical protein
LILDLFLEFSLALNLILELCFNLKIGKLMIAVITDLVYLLVHLRQPSEILRTSIANAATTVIAVASVFDQLYETFSTELTFVSFLTFYADLIGVEEFREFLLSITIIDKNIFIIKII